MQAVKADDLQNHSFGFVGSKPSLRAKWKNMDIELFIYNIKSLNYGKEKVLCCISNNK